ncbi:MAG: efflux RND transporter periplasmic adaptor subunit [Opitutaceae bacterium]|nr:efflux RND transporter periplasmic adaptor subunit [Opitutaceae bacterium]
MKWPRLQRRTVVLLVVLASLAVLFAFVVIRSGPLARVAVTVSKVESRAVVPAIYGMGTVQARHRYKIGPVQAGRILRVTVNVGDSVSGGQVLGEMDPVDLDARILGQEAAIRGGEAVLRQAEARLAFAHAQARRYEQSLVIRGTSEESVSSKQQEEDVAGAALQAAHDAIDRLRAELKALHAQRNNLRLVAPGDGGLVVARHAEPGSTVVGGQVVIELIDPRSLWVDARFDQISAEGLAAGLPATIVLRSRRDARIRGRVLWVEPQADVVTEETLAKIVFESEVSPIPPVGELVEATLMLPALPESPVIPNAAIRTFHGRRGVWVLTEKGIEFRPVITGRADLDGRVQVMQGLTIGDQVVVYGEKVLTPRSRSRVVKRLVEMTP